MSSHFGSGPGLVVPDATSESERAAVETLPLQVQTTSAGSYSQPVDRDDTTGAARWLGVAPWNDVEIARFLKRVGLFKRRGLTADDAEALSDLLVIRDRERDDRRCCLECDSLQQTGTCFRRLPISRTQLVRCVGFRWQQP